MATSPIPSRLEVSPPAWTTPEFTPPPWTLPQDLEKELEWDKTNLSQDEKYIIALIRYIVKIENNEFSNNFYAHAASKNNFLEHRSLAANIELVRFIDKLPSWDRIKFYGGKKIKGDLRKILKTFKTEPPLYVLRRGSKILVKAPRDASETRNKLENGEDIDILFEIDGKIGECPKNCVNHPG